MLSWCLIESLLALRTYASHSETRARARWDLAERDCKNSCRLAPEETSVSRRPLRYKDFVQISRAYLAAIHYVTFPCGNQCSSRHDFINLWF